jgi:hypothetical protein
MLTWEQVIFLSVGVCNYMRMSNDLMLALDFALERLVGGKEK